MFRVTPVYIHWQASKRSSNSHGHDPCFVLDNCPSVHRPDGQHVFLFLGQIVVRCILVQTGSQHGLHPHHDLCDRAMSLCSASGCRINIKLGDVWHFLAHCYSALLVDCSHSCGCRTSLRALFWLLKLCVCLLPHCRTKIPLGDVRHFLAGCYSPLLVACFHLRSCPTSPRVPFCSLLCRRCMLVITGSQLVFTSPPGPL